ncbi:protein unc-93 homolog A isoform X1 [Peromyscus maniculatus bairdii]|uniref:protein unc-93 homolog A isoform X1 n=1 Tax=Peromyscus maniculatus bairdii TaxID=230844 RepID=UPI003FD00707
MLGKYKHAYSLTSTGGDTSICIMEKNLRNILVVSFGFFFNFTAFGGLQNLQSSLYSEGGLGVATLSTIYGSMMLSSMFLSPLLIKKFGCKWTMVGSMSCYLTFSLANFYANWYTLIPTSILLGLGAAPLWASQCTYITIVGNLQAKKEKKLGKDVVNQYFGVFFLVFQSSGVCGNLISSLVFSQTPTHVTIPDSQLQSCGAKDCLMATVASNNTSKPSKQLIYTLLSIFNGSSILAILLLIVFLESVEDRMENEREAGPRSPPLWSTLLATFMLFKNDKRLRLLILLPLYSGMNQGFMNGEYTKVPPHCALCCMGRSPSTRAGLHSSRWESIRKSGGSTWVPSSTSPALSPSSCGTQTRPIYLSSLSSLACGGWQMQSGRHRTMICQKTPCPAPEAKVTRLFRSREASGCASFEFSVTHKKYPWLGITANMDSLAISLPGSSTQEVSGIHTCIHTHRRSVSI